MLSRLERELPSGDYLYEPKWDGFRALGFRSDGWADLQSRNLNRFGRYFPELVEAMLALAQSRFVIDGEIVIIANGVFDFGALLNRLHPAASRVARLSVETPATFIAFDLLAEGDESLMHLPFVDRRRRLEALLEGSTRRVVVTPATHDVATAEAWLEGYTGGGVDGVVAKPLGLRYLPGKRAMTKVKPERTADCVVAGLRITVDGVVTSLLLGLYDDAGVLRHVGVASSFSTEHGRELAATLRPFSSSLAGHPWEHGFGIERRPMGRLRGAAGVWTPEMTQDWIPLRPELVCEVTYGQAVDMDLVFCNPAGKPLDATRISKEFHQHLDRAGLPQRRFHDLRHSCATLLLVQGVAPRVVMDVLGHSQIAMTMNTYSHVIPDLRRQAADRMDELINDR